MKETEKQIKTLLKTYIYSFDDFTEEENSDLARFANEIDAVVELSLAYEFISEASSESHVFDKVSSFVNPFIMTLERDEKMPFLEVIWDAANIKGYITEIEAITLLKLTKSWGVDKDLLLMMRKKRA